jgi:hypothetical protein
MGQPRPVSFRAALDDLRVFDGDIRIEQHAGPDAMIAPDRSANGYRDYDERLVDRVLQIRGLLEASLPTRMIKRILPCLNVPGILYCRRKPARNARRAGGRT